MSSFRGWLLDLYLNLHEGLSLWFIDADTDARRCFYQDFPITFYAAGANEHLRALWRYLRLHEKELRLSRNCKQDVFLTNPVDVLQMDVLSPQKQLRLFEKLEAQFPDLTWYDADVSIGARYQARYGVFPLALCELEADETKHIRAIRPCNSRWDLMPQMPPLRILEIRPDADPARAPVTALSLQAERHSFSLPLHPVEDLLAGVNKILEDYDPDILVSDWGDNWLMPFLNQVSQTKGIPLKLNRDAQRGIHWQKESSYFSYGRIIHRPEEAHLFGRCHIDRKSAMMWADYSLAGSLEMARVTTLPIEKASRVSPGQGISAMQVITALEKDILVPYQKQQVEAFKSGLELIQSDRGGMIYQPITGLHSDVAEIDFVSMYPAVIIKGNISPEVPLPEVLEPTVEELGLVPLTLKPLYEKRVAIKQKMRTYPPGHPLVANLKERAAALKWLLVVCFGFLGYKNARYGRIEAHEAVTRGGREVLLRAKEVAEEEGYSVLHMYVDALWVKKKGSSRPEHFTHLITRINERTGLTINLDGIFRWLVFLPSKSDARIPIANRCFGVFQSGEVKVRGLECRRRDTPIWIATVQRRMIDKLAEARSLDAMRPYLLEAFRFYQQSLADLQAGRVPLDDLLINGKVSYALSAYRSSTPAVRAARQLEAMGHVIRPGQRIRFLYILGAVDVFPWDSGLAFAPERLNLVRYVELLLRAGISVLEPFGVSAGLLREWSLSGCYQQSLPLV